MLFTEEIKHKYNKLGKHPNFKDVKQEVKNMSERSIIVDDTKYVWDQYAIQQVAHIKRFFVKLECANLNKMQVFQY